ncbi:hypothetical protein PZB74_16740 [Porifericola rhodea]|uniref:hypothetical protein n=1 Tax=Porifericola rhodea TaxID=930972 RepID=UPI0026661BA6|nr:hypothetical protein [Porifericola rhodea]WKN30611.1 hypothetical protein PZB74_16740 [Porifericola rhodea]
MKTKTTSVFLLKNTPETLIGTHVYAKDTIERIRANAGASNDESPNYSILIYREEDIHYFVSQVPELAWEMIEYAEEPLELLLPHKKYQTPFDESSFISIRLVKEEKLKQFVRKNGPIIAFRAAKNFSEDALIDETVDCREKDSKYTVVKVMKLFEDGSFTFLR